MAPEARAIVEQQPPPGDVPIPGKPGISDGDGLNERQSAGGVVPRTSEKEPAPSNDDDLMEEQRELAFVQNSMLKANLDQERRLGRLPKRLAQAALHQTLTDVRIEELEKELSRLKAIVHKQEDDFKYPFFRRRLPVHRHELVRASANEFRLTTESVLLPPRQQPVLEVQTSEGLLGSTQPGVATGSAHPAAPAAGDPNATRSAQLPPERLRIRSHPLLGHLKKIAGGEFLSPGEAITLDGIKVYNAQLFLRPFKFFVKHAEAIRSSVPELEAEIQREAAKEASDVQERHDNGRKRHVEEFDKKDLLEDLKLLVSFLDNDLRPTFELRQRIRDGTEVEIEYAGLWHLFERGDVVCTRTNQAHARMVINKAGGRDPLMHRPGGEELEGSAPVEGFALDCLSIGSDGSSYVPKLEKFSIHKFHGRKPITSLPVYPLRFDPNADALRAKFVEGGRQFLEVTRSPFSHRTVQGRTLDEPSYDLSNQVIVDMSLAMDARPEWRPRPTIPEDELTLRDKRETLQRSWCAHKSRRQGCCGGDIIYNDLEQDKMDADDFMNRSGGVMGPLKSDDLTERELVLMQPFVHVFVLRSRQWSTVRTADLRDVLFENSWDDLELPEHHKTTVQALVKTHENARTSLPPPSSAAPPAAARSHIGAALDLVKGKGSGLVILLHGPPGVGKTSTAECVADNTRRPLYPITCGDIGETAAEVEARLQYSFRLAHKWGCVLLLDEADIFLARRTRSNLRHNAVTSVFLRSLEYYAGILFLTTNRVGAVDPAFKSRIQMSLFYPRLDLDVTTRLYEKFIKRARAEQERTGGASFKIKDREILKFAKRHFRALEKHGHNTWNGRQIRNAFQTAIALTEHEIMVRAPDDLKPVLGRDQFEIVAEGFRKFDEYLISTLSATESDEAKREGVRDDAFGAASVSAPGNPTGKGHYSSSDEDSETDSDSDAEGGSSTKRKRAGENSKAVQASEMEQFQQFLEWQKMQAGRK